jgi:hypothetical protein
VRIEAKNVGVGTSAGAMLRAKEELVAAPGVARADVAEPSTTPWWNRMWFASTSSSTSRPGSILDIRPQSSGVRRISCALRRPLLHAGKSVYSWGRAPLPWFPAPSR